MRVEFKTPRSRLEMVIDLLRVIRKYSINYSGTRAVSSANWRQSLGLATLKKLELAGFCECVPRSRYGRGWRLTEKGRVWLRQIESLVKQMENCLSV